MGEVDVQPGRSQGQDQQLSDCNAAAAAGATSQGQESFKMCESLHVCVSVCERERMNVCMNACVRENGTYAWKVDNVEQ